MKDCLHCHAQIPDDAEVCPSCGTPVEAAPVETVPEAAVEAAPVETVPEATAVEAAPVETVPEAAVEAAPVEPVPEAAPAQPAPAPAAPAAPAPAKPKKKKKGALIGIIAAVLAVVIVLLSVVVFSPKKSKLDRYVMYVKDEEVFFRDLKADESVKMTDNLFKGMENVDAGDSADCENYLSNSAIHYSEDGRYALYGDHAKDKGGMELYIRDLKDADAEPIKVDSDVEFNFASADLETIFYTTVERELYKYTRSTQEKVKISKDIDDLYFIPNQEVSEILYAKNEKQAEDDKNKDKKRTYTLMLYNGQESVEISKGVLTFSASDNLNVIAYKTEDGLYLKKGDAERVKVDTDVYALKSVSKTGELYYEKENPTVLTYQELIEDDSAEEDARLAAEPFPDIYNYYYYSDYYAAIDAWEARQKKAVLHAAIRSDMTKTAYEVECKDLYFYNGEESKKVAENVQYASVLNGNESEHEVLTYSLYATEISAKVKMSEIKSEKDIDRLAEKALEGKDAQPERYIMVQGEYFALPEDSAYPKMTADNSAIYGLKGIDEEDGTGTLYQIKMKNNKPGDAVNYDTDVFKDNISCFGDDGILYFKDVTLRDRDDADMGMKKGDLYVNGEKVDIDVNGTNHMYYDKTNKALYYITDYDTDDHTGTLKYYKKGEAVKAADDVYRYAILPGGDVLYLTDYNLKKYKGELYCFDGKESTKIDDDVACILRARTPSEWEELLGSL